MVESSDSDLSWAQVLRDAPRLLNRLRSEKKTPDCGRSSWYDAFTYDRSNYAIYCAEPYEIASDAVRNCRRSTGVQANGLPLNLPCTTE